MVIVFVETAAELLTVSVSVLVEVAGLGLNDAVTPVDSALVLRVTLPENPPVGTTVIVLVLLLPRATVKAAGDAFRVKFPNGLFTVSVIVVAFVNLPDVPVIVTVNVPVAAVALAFKVSVLVLPAATVTGLKDAVTPVGKPDATSFTLPLNPFCGVMVIVLVPLFPCVMVTVLGEGERTKFGLGAGQLFARLAAFTDPIPVAKSQPVVVP